MKIDQLPYYQKKEREVKPANVIPTTPARDPLAPVVIVSLVRDIRNVSQFRLWDEPTQSWLRTRNQDEAVLIQAALDNNYRLRVTLAGKEVKEIELV